MASPDFTKCLTSVVEKYQLPFELREKQVEALKHIFNLEDTICNLPTGYGRSIIYHLLPALFSVKGSNMQGADEIRNVKCCVLVISPLNAIQVDQLQELSTLGIKACRLSTECHAFDKDSNEIELSNLYNGKFEIIFCHPEAHFSTQKGQELVDNPDFTDLVAAIVIDECHKVDEWCKDFRKAFNDIPSLKVFFQDAPFLALSATMTKFQLGNLKKTLGFNHGYHLVSITPDRPNIFLERREKLSSAWVTEAYERIYKPECEKLAENPDQYPVTLMYLPLHICGEAGNYCRHLFGHRASLENCCYGILFSKQDSTVHSVITNDLKKDNPRIRLVFCTSSVGMGFNAKSITRIIHGRPPRTLTDYFQEVGRAGRAGQRAVAILYNNKSDVAHNLPGIKEDIITYCKTDGCLRESVLSIYGYDKNDNSPRGCECCSNCRVTCSCEKCLITGVEMTTISA